MKASLTRKMKVPVTAEKLAILFEKLTGRKPTDQEIDEVRRTLARMLHALVLTIVFGSIAMAEPLP